MNSVAMSSAPGRKAQAPAQSLSTLTAPTISANSPTEPTMGQWLLCGT